MKINCVLFFQLLLVCLSGLAQDKLLSLERVVQLTLKNNYNIRLSTEETAKAKTLNTVGNAGMLPTLNFSSALNFANNATKQNFANGLVVDKKNVKSNNISSGIFFSWTLFDGLKMFHIKEGLNQEELLKNLELKKQIETTLFDLLKSYYTIIKQKKNQNIFQENLKLSQSIFELAQAKEKSGLSSGADLMLAKINLNQTSAALIKEDIQLNELKTSFLLLINEESLSSDFNLEDTLLFSFPEMNTPVKNWEGNVDLLLLKKKDDIEKNKLRLNASNYFPRLNLTSNYLFSRNENAAGFALLNQNLGWNNGFSLSWSIFNGGTTLIDRKILQINLLQSKTRHEQLSKLLSNKESTLDYAIGQKLRQIELETQNKNMADELVRVSLIKYEQGLINLIELKMVQQEAFSIYLRQIEIAYEIQILELEKKKLTGKLIQ